MTVHDDRTPLRDPPPSSGVPVDLASAHAQLQNLLVAAPELTELLRQTAQLAAGVVGRSSCGITLRRDTGFVTAGSSDALAERVDELQYGRGRGPCLEALNTGTEIEASDLATDRRWGDYSAHAVSYGIRSSVSIPLAIGGGITIGVLNVYSADLGPLEPAVAARLRLFADQASTVIRLVLRRVDDLLVETQMREAMASRTVIDQALGILMAQRRVTSAEAFTVLREASQAQNRKLHLVAADVIEQLTGRPPMAPRPFTNRRRRD